MKVIEGDLALLRTGGLEGALYGDGRRVQMNTKRIWFLTGINKLRAAIGDLHVQQRCI